MEEEYIIGGGCYLSLVGYGMEGGEEGGGDKDVGDREKGR